MLDCWPVRNDISLRGVRQHMCLQCVSPPGECIIIIIIIIIIQTYAFTTSLIIVQRRMIKLLCIHSPGGNAQKVADIISDNNDKTFFFVAAIGRRFLSYLFRYECVTNLVFWLPFWHVFTPHFTRWRPNEMCRTSTATCDFIVRLLQQAWCMHRDCIAGLSSRAQFVSAFWKGNAVNCRSPTWLIYSEKNREKIFPRSILIMQPVFFVLHVANACACVASSDTHVFTKNRLKQY